MSTTKISQHVIGSGAITASHVSNITTANITENTNLYHTSARARGAISVTGGYLSYDSGTGVIQLTFSTPASNSNDTTPATTAYVTSAIGAINSFTGTIGSSSTATTQSASDNTTKLATTAFVGTAITNVIGGAPGTLDTLNELAAAINDDASYASTLTTALATKAPLASPTFTTTITTPDINITGGSQIGQDYAYLKSNSTTNASLTLRKDSTGADAIDFLQLRSDGNGLIGKIEGDGDISFRNATFTGTITSGAIVTTSNTATQFKNATDTDIQHRFETNQGADFAIHRLIGSDGVDNKFIIGYGPNHPSTANHIAIKNNHASGSIGFNTSASSTERMRITSSGNVGIGTGTDNPADRLVVQKDSANIEPMLVLKNDNTTDDNGVSIDFSGKDTGGNNITYGRIATKYTNHATEKSHMIFTHRNDAGNFVQWMGVDHDGHVGIGENNPSDKLHISGGNLLLNNAIEIRSKDTGGNVRTITRVNSSNELEYGWSANGPVKFMGGGSYGEKMRINADGNIGIGEISPDRTFHVKSGTTNVVAKFESTDGIAAIEFTDPNGSAEIGCNGNDVVLFPAGAEKMRVNTSGNIVAQSATQNRIVLGSTGNSSNNTSNWMRGNAGYLQFNSASSGYNWEIGGSNKMAMDSAGVLTLTSNEFRVGNSATYPLRAAGSGTVMRGASVHHMIVHDHRTPKQSSAPHGHMSFGFTSYALNNSSPWADILYLQSYTDASGGAPNAIVVSRSASNFKVVRYPWSSTSTTAISGGTQYALAGSTSSDQRLKENVNNITNGLDIIKALRPVTYNWTDEFLQAGLSKNETEIEAEENGTLIAPETKVENVGLIAQEVEAVLPTIIHENEISFGGTDYKTIHYDKLVPHLIAAIKELEARIKTLEG